MSNRKKGANTSDQNSILMMQAQGFDAEQIAATLLIDDVSIKSFMKFNETAEKKNKKGEVTAPGNKHKLDAMQQRLKSAGDNSGDVAALREQVEMLTKLVNGQVQRTEGLVNDDGEPVKTGDAPADDI